MLMNKIARELMRPFSKRRIIKAGRGEPRLPQPDPQQVREAFFTQLIRKTENFGRLTWLGNPIWQNVLDLWTIQETISEVQPDLLIECGTNRGGSSMFYAHLMDLLG